MTRPYPPLTKLFLQGDYTMLNKAEPTTITLRVSTIEVQVPVLLVRIQSYF